MEITRKDISDECKMMSKSMRCVDFRKRQLHSCEFITVQGTCRVCLETELESYVCLGASAKGLLLSC